ncbi:MAG: hypothetical protein RL141_198 [Candidatus Parcubacteria bacterium]|jgi:hypothetical protein
MFNFFLLIFVLSTIGLCIGLISPAPFSKLLQRNFSRKQLAKGFGWLIAVSFVLASFTAQATVAETESFNEAPIAAEETRTQKEVETPSIVEEIADVTDAVAEIIAPAPPSPVTEAAIVQQKDVATTDEETIPEESEGASARCEDGTYSFSESRRGTCSHHGGVAEWY